MGVLNKPNNKSLIGLAVVSAITSVLFSFAGAPFLRALFISTRSVVFWTTAIMLVGALFVLGLTNYKVSETAVYVGAIWMTLGIYSELEKRGVNWKSSSLISVSAGFLFTLAGYFLILKNLTTENVLSQMVEPLRNSITKAFPEAKTEDLILESIIPGIISAGLFASLAFSWAFEASAIRMFGLKAERVASRIRWLDFRMPDISIWTTLTCLLVFSTVQNEIAKMIAVNVLIVALIAFLFQGFTVVEFVMRYYRFGLFSRTLIYLLIVLQLGPVLVLLGFADYWADFRKLIRKKQKQKI
jgi:hypothetical protein